MSIPTQTDFDLIDAFSRTVLNYAAALYKQGEMVFSNVKFENAWEDRDVAWAGLEMRFNDLRQQIEAATRYAENLAVALHAEHYADNTQWRPLSGDLIGILTQIDNMTSGLVLEPTNIKPSKKGVTE